jgi:hypothetical protein
MEPVFGLTFRAELVVYERIKFERTGSSNPQDAESKVSNTIIMISDLNISAKVLQVYSFLCQHIMLSVKIQE